MGSPDREPAGVEGQMLTEARNGAGGGGYWERSMVETDFLLPYPVPQGITAKIVFTHGLLLLFTINTASRRLFTVS